VCVCVANARAQASVDTTVSTKTGGAKQLLSNCLCYIECV
jgi:hypothetical protein